MRLLILLTTTAALILVVHAPASAQRRPEPLRRPDPEIGITITRAAYCGDSSATVTVGGSGGSTRGEQRPSLRPVPCVRPSQVEAETEPAPAVGENPVRKGMLYGALFGAVSGAIIGAAIADPHPRVMFSGREYAALGGGVLGAVAGAVVGGIAGALHK